MMNKFQKFEYSNDDRGVTPFETFQRYSNEKQQTSIKIAEIINSFRTHPVSLLDVGAGDGLLTQLYLSKIESVPQKITLIEPSVDLINKLRLNLSQFDGLSTINILNERFQEYATDQKFDVIIASHVPFTGDTGMETLPSIYMKLLSLLDYNGVLILIQRANDDIHSFREKFKSILNGRIYNSYAINDAQNVFGNVVADDPLNHITIYHASSELLFPKDNQHDRIAIIEFLLNTKWNQIQRDVKAQINDYLAVRNNRLGQSDGILVFSQEIENPPPNREGGVSERS